MEKWKKVLFAYRDGKFDRYFYGLTPRLIVGACQDPLGEKFENEKVAYHVTKQIFEEMRNYNVNGIIVSSNHCGIHKGPVLQFKEAEWTNESIGTDFHSVWNRYGDEILLGKFGISQYDHRVLSAILKVQ